jgi:hypothetical protein
MSATPPEVTAEHADPPSPDEAVRLLAAAEEHSSVMAMLTWLAMVTGARRGELCALRWPDVNQDEGDLLISGSYAARKGQRMVKPTKTYRKRRLALDPGTLEATHLVASLYFQETPPRKPFSGRKIFDSYVPKVFRILEVAPARLASRTRTTAQAVRGARAPRASQTRTSQSVRRARRVRAQYSTVEPGQMARLTPASSRYRLRQPPALHTARCSLRCRVSLYTRVIAVFASIVLALS